MDYGKLAYYKAEELEQRMSRSSGAAVTVSSVTVSGLPEDGGFAALSGSGLLIVRVRSSGGTVKLYADDALIGEGAGDFTVASAAGDCVISATADGAAVKEITVTSSGGAVRLTSPPLKLCADGNGGLVVAADTDGGLLKLTVFNADGQAERSLTLGRAADFDVATDGSSVYAALADESGNAAVIKLSTGLEFVWTRVLGSGSVVALSANGGTLNAAWSTGSAVNLAAYTADGQRISGTKISGGGVRGIALAKGAKNAVCFLYANGQTLLRRHADEAEARLTCRADASIVYS